VTVAVDEPEPLIELETLFEIETLAVDEPEPTTVELILIVLTLLNLGYRPVG
jgi:hypothetical protein